MNAHGLHLSPDFSLSSPLLVMDALELLSYYCDCIAMSRGSRKEIPGKTASMMQIRSEV
jgi:hypothetical protein